MDVLIGKSDGILTIEFNRPEKKNAITAAMYEAMAAALHDAESDREVCVILFAGKPEVFSAGNDLEDFLRHPPQDAESSVYRFMRNLSLAEKPVIAAVAGNAVGIGATLLLHCDLVYAAENAKFSMPFVKLGLCPEFASSLLLPRLAGHQCAAEMLLLGEAISAKKAMEMGWVNRVLPVDELMSFALVQAAKMTVLPSSSLRETKRLMKTDAPLVDARILQEMTVFAAMLKSPEAKEAFTAFFEKRAPDFSKFP
jgi:enoyl-CoA hydratase/carnithine racemase